MDRDDAMDYQILYEMALVDNTRLRAALWEIEQQATAVKPPRYSWFGERAAAALKDTTP